MNRRLTLLMLAALAYTATGLFFVQPDEQAIVRRFGRALELPREPGPHFGLPWGLDRVDRYRPREVKLVTLGPLQLGSQAVGSSEAEYLTGDRNLVQVRASVQFSIREPRLYLYQASPVDAIVAKAGEATLSRMLAGEAVDRALTLGKQELALGTRNLLQERVDQYGLGITIRSVDIGSVRPPAEVAEAFDNVISALRRRDQQIYQSQSYASRSAAEAQASAQRIRDESRAFRDRVVREAEGEAARFGKLLAEYLLAPDLTARRLYLETIAETLPRFRSKVILDQGQGIDLSILGQEKP